MTLEFDGINGEGAGRMRRTHGDMQQLDHELRSSSIFLRLRNGRGRRIADRRGSFSWMDDGRTLL